MRLIDHLKLEQLETCGQCRVETMPICCSEEGCDLWHRVHDESEVMACAYCEEAMSCTKRAKFEED